MFGKKGKTVDSKSHSKKIVLFALFVLIAFAFSERLQDHFLSFYGSKEALTFEARYTAEELMRKHATELLSDKEHAFLEPKLQFHPFLLMEVKYMQKDGRTREGSSLWGLIDGELVLNTDSFETTHGFHDAILGGASEEDFKILNALARQRGALSKEDLLKELNTDTQTLDRQLAQAKKKQLILQKEGLIRLHFQNPKFLVAPETRITQYFVSKPFQGHEKAGKQFSGYEIEKIAKAAFGQDFTIRRTKEVYLPVYTLTVQNPDGSLLTSDWNAVTGRRIPERYIH